MCVNYLPNCLHASMIRVSITSPSFVALHILVSEIVLPEGVCYKNYNIIVYLHIHLLVSEIAKCIA